MSILFNSGRDITRIACRQSFFLWTSISLSSFGCWLRKSEINIKTIRFSFGHIPAPFFPTGRTLHVHGWATHTRSSSRFLFYIYFTMFSYFSLFFWKKILLFFFCFPMCALASQVFFFFYLVQPFACQGTPPSFPPTPNLYPVLVRSRRSLFFYFILFKKKKANIQ